MGLRPTSVDDRAVVGRLPGWGNAWVATGHGANGLLQGPYSARVLAHAMAGVAQPTDEAPLPEAGSTPAVSPEDLSRTRSLGRGRGSGSSTRARPGPEKLSP